MKSRAASALILLGLIALVVFLITFSGQQPDYRIFLIGAGLSILGLNLRRRAVRQSSRRGRLLRRILGYEIEEPED